jgi:ABC-2 type transport system ATP-binding protein
MSAFPLASNGSPMIQVQELTKRFGSSVAVDRLTFDVQPGRVTGFLGPNGAGKSTTLRMILGLDTPTRGRALVGGRAYRTLDHPLCLLGALLDAAETHGGRSARDHLAWLAASNGIPRSRVHEVLQQTGIASVSGRRVRTLSLGMRQRLGIAVALLGDPKILVLDEPTNGLDPDGIRWLRGLLTSLAEQGRTVLVSSHLIAEMAVIADHLVVIGSGRLLADASVEELTRLAPAADRRTSLEAAYFGLVESTVEFR